MRLPLRYKKRKLSSEINVVPFIDVMLVLLVIFMITAPMMNQGVDVDLPRTSSEPIDIKITPIIVSIDKQGKYFLTHGNKTQGFEINQLAQNIAPILKAQPKTPVMVRGDRQVAYGDVMSLMAVLQQAGVPNVGLISQPGANQ